MLPRPNSCTTGQRTDDSSDGDAKDSSGGGEDGDDVASDEGEDSGGDAVGEEGDDGAGAGSRATDERTYSFSFVFRLTQ